MTTEELIDLTDEQIDDTWAGVSNPDEDELNIFDFARAIIKADRAQRQAVQEPVAWRTRYKSKAVMIGNYPWTYTERVRAVERLSPSYEFETLYTAAPQPAQVPLTPEQIEDMRGEANRGFNIEREDYTKAVRDTEAAHGVN